MSDGLKIVSIAIWAIILPSILIIWALLAWRGVQCEARFEDSALPWRYSWAGGCQVKTPEQGWIPAANYRVI